MLPLSAQELCTSVREGRGFELARLDRVLGVDAARSLVEVQSGASWKHLARHLRPDDAGAAELRTTRATIGESIAWNAAGPDGRAAVEHVEAFTMVTPDGHLRRIDRMRHRDLFSLVVGGQGVFGALYSVLLRLDSLARAVAEAQAAEVLDAAKMPTGARALVLLVPPARLAELLDGCRSHCAEWRIAPGRIEVRRIHPESESFLRWARRDYAELTLALPMGSTLGGEVRHTQLRRALIDLAIALGGSFPIACTPEATRAQTEACYPQLPGFLAEQRRIDPLQRWTNEWLHRQRNLLTCPACEVRWAH